jgi:hypothetical protein
MTSITLLLTLVLAIFVVFSYHSRELDLTHGGCVIVGATKNYEYVTSKSGQYYFYRVITGHREYIWLAGSFYTIHVDYVVPENNDPIYYATYIDGYKSETDRNRAFAQLVINQTRTSCWYETNKKSGQQVTKEALMGGQIAGVCIFSVLSFILVCANTLVGLLVFCK